MVVPRCARINELLNSQLESLQENSGGGFCTVLQKLREEMRAEFETYRSDAETAVNGTLAEMKAQLAAGVRDREAVEYERNCLRETVAQLQGDVNRAQAEV